ncbi:MAG: alanine--tRNA ligase [Candidatus Yanofskybacteria bacterium]|nr:alanine--tRNA ligase [Candidatus Yanofskybacteria bacterium]
MTHQEIRHKFLDFFEKRGHKIVPSSSLLPDDPSVLFTTAGMQQFKPYYTGQADAMKDFGSLNTASIQKAMRTSDIDEVGDKSHLTFFEMLGNFSFGGYWKKEAIEYAYEFLTKELKLEIDYVSVFEGEKDIPADEESEKIWKSVAPGIEIKKMGREDNFWGPTGNEGPCGPTSEIFVNGVEVWNLVFNEYYCHPDGKLEKLKTSGVDTGMGLDRLSTVIQNKKNIFETDLLEPILKLAPLELEEKVKRVIADHSRAIAFLISDEVQPSNKEQGYILRRLMRRIITHNFIAKADLTLMHDIFAKIAEIYGQHYPNLNAGLIINIFDSEKEKFEKTLSHGLKELQKLDKIDAQSAFKLYESYGLPYEIIKELGEKKSEKLTREKFDEEFKKHQELSRAGAEKKFGGHGLLLDTGKLRAGNEQELKKATRLHTATHLLHTALRKILGNEVKQVGSDITAERLRFDFTFPRKLTNEEIKKVEDLVNEVIKKDLPVTKEEMPYEEALKTGALSFFKLKYPPKVNVYSVGDFSKELCGGPHVSHTGEIGKFSIKKEEAIGAGIRRIRAIVLEQ